jgi:hypothetical protein
MFLQLESQFLLSRRENERRKNQISKKEIANQNFCSKRYRMRMLKEKRRRKICCWSEKLNIMKNSRKKRSCWHDEKNKKKSTHVRSNYSKESNFFYIIVFHFIVFEKIERWFFIFEFWFFKRFFFFNIFSFLFSVLCEISSTMFHDDWKLIARFYSALNDLSREECNVCNKIEFAMQLKQFDIFMKCHQYRTNKKKNFIMISLFEEINNMNFFLLSFHLSHLSIAKKFFIARVHVFMNLRRVKNCQYKYSEHVINFMQNIVKIIHWYFNLFSKLQIFILKSFFSFVKKNNVTISFREIFRIRRKYVEIWLKFLIKNHSNYKIIFIDFEHFEQLFENDTIWD